VCLKRLPCNAGPERVAELREEGRVLAAVRHANVVSALAFEEDDEGALLVLELVEGLDLAALRRAFGDQRLADPVAVHVACALLRALGAAARSVPGLVHRDVTPHNVLLSVHGEVKLADFGIALAGDRPRSTGPLLVKGKVGYMSPEQILGDDLDARSDLFAVGVVLYELLAGVRPWAPVRGMAELQAVIDRPPVPLRVRRPDVDGALAAVVDRLLDREPTRRFATADDALRALARFGAGELGSLRLAALVAVAMRADADERALRVENVE
jgi:serine/threonine protein kinase